ncbi:hypothetical protein MMP64_12265 [Acinetobacter sp. ANC 5659]|uniref:hypothetical protein n=1 Tax=Acinetobacter higginsii TaxID=70347 RepID=UPI0002CD70DA|nr:hypothetical protein [Acinetobacter higginsii]ENX60698.1 hypothetical protein F885_01806 [Acinetobacter higginsii]MCH7318702.1 hypothetical protein [Acinetobacter higginsii]
MSSDAEKQIAFEMAKAIICEREKYSGSHLEQVDKVVTPEYWLEVYHQCLNGLTSPKKITKISQDNLNKI